MSEEEKLNNTEENEKISKCTILTVLVVISLLFSTVSLIMSAYTFKNGGSQAASNGAPAHEKPKVVISKQYDRGRSFAKALETKKPIIAFFYTDWCGFCQRFVPTFDKVTKDSKIKKNFAIAYVNCEKEENQKVVADYGVQGFPTVYVIDSTGKRTQLDNATFFNDDSKEVLVKNMLEAAGIKE